MIEQGGRRGQRDRQMKASRHGRGGKGAESLMIGTGVRCIGIAPDTIVTTAL